jgi:O-antigen/teichoic acid export membrane protein
VLTLRSGPESIALWAQLYSLIELVAGVALAGIGTGLSVLVAQSTNAARQRDLLHEGFRLGMAIAIPAMLAVMVLAWLFPGRAAAYGVSPSLMALAALVGCLTVLPGMMNSYWLGQQRRERMLALAVVSALLPLMAALAAPLPALLFAVALAHALPALAAPFVGRNPAAAPLRDFFAAPSSRRFFRAPLPRRLRNFQPDHDIGLLRHYLWAGISIGILSPASMLAARAIVSSGISWHEAGQLQALWRVSDWVGSIAAGVMSVYFLPRMSAAYGTAQFGAVLRRCARTTLIPAGLALLLLLAFERPVFALLYDDSIAPSRLAAALFFAGTFARIASWVPFFALYSMRRTRAVTIGEVLSLPLFAALLALSSQGLTLERTGGLWLASYIAYGTFNFWAAGRHTPSSSRL